MDYARGPIFLNFWFGPNHLWGGSSSIILESESPAVEEDAAVELTVIIEAEAENDASATQNGDFEITGLSNHEITGVKIYRANEMTVD